MSTETEISGIYSAVFRSNNNQVGSGVAVFSNYFVHGGDAACYYRGKCIRGEHNTITGYIEVVKYSAAASPIFPFDSYRLLLNGIEMDSGFELSGQVEGHPHFMIQISLQRMDDLIDQD